MKFDFSRVCFCNDDTIYENHDSETRDVDWAAPPGRHRFKPKPTLTK